MNQQIPFFFGQLGAMVAVAIFFYNFLKGRKLYDSEVEADLFTIGYVQHPNQLSVQAKVFTEQEKVQDTQLYKDCRDALVALGVKKTQANSITKNFFKNKQPEDLQSFLREFNNENKS